MRGDHERPVAASVLTAAGIVLAGASCSHVTPLGPGRASVTMPAPRHLGSPIILQVMRSRPPMATGGCPAGWVTIPRPPRAAPMPCFRPIGAQVRITSAAVSAVATSLPPPGMPKQPASYGITIAVPAADVAAVTALIKRAYDDGGAVGISTAGILWEAPRVITPFPGRQLQIALVSKDRVRQLYRILIPSG